jgi:hypothetical protein
MAQFDRLGTLIYFDLKQNWIDLELRNKKVGRKCLSVIRKGLV